MNNGWLWMIGLIVLQSSLIQAQDQDVTTVVNSTSRNGKQLFKFQNGRIVLNLPEENVIRNDRHRSCTTPLGREGFCLDLSDCPNLILNLDVLRKSVCFKSLFVPGVCCPKFTGSIDTNVVAVTTEKSTTTPTTTAKTTTTKRPKRKKPNKNRDKDKNKPNKTTTTTQTPKTESTQVSTTQSTTRQTTIRQTTTPQTTTRNFTTTTQPPIIEHFFSCGEPVIPKYRIVGGTESQRGLWPWMVAIFLHGPKGSEFWCGGSLISKRYIMTAAHCTRDGNDKTFHPLQFSVRVGDHNIFSNSDDHLSKPAEYRVQEIKTHPKFIRQGFYNDIALLKLEREVAYSEYVLPVCLPSPSLAGLDLDYLAGASPVVIGYGAKKYNGNHSQELREVTLPIWKNRDCDSKYFQPITDIFLCAGYYNGGHDACQGDSGGPLQLFRDNRYVQIGIVSFGNKCADPGYPGVYTRVSKFLSWVYHSMT